MTSNRRERVQILLPAEFPGVMAGRVERSPQHFRWFHTTYTVATMIDGGGTWTCDRREHETVPGTLSFWQPGETHAVNRLYSDSDGERATTQRFLTIPPAWVEEAAAARGLRRSVLRTRVDGAAPLHRAFLAFHASIEGPTSRLERESRLARCLDLMAGRVFEESGRARETRPEPDAVRRAKALILERHAEALTLAELAAAAGVDRFRLLRAFVREVGLPPHQFQLTVRVARARELLARRHPAAQVAAELGFADQSHFIRVFRRQMGVTPGAYGR
jgi:AraC-like DNA-binding protein